MYILRDLEEKIKKYLNLKEIVAILGPRQVGKTTLMKHVYEDIEDDKIFLDFEDMEIVQLFDEDIKGFAKLYIEGKKYVFFDEFQYSLKGGKNLKFLYDSYDVKIIVSGSSSSDISIKLLSYLTGRIFIMELFPLSLKEILNHNLPKEYSIANEYLIGNKKVPSAIHKTLIEYSENTVIYGGYPRVFLSETEDERKDVLKNLVLTYLMKEIRGFFRISRDYSFNRLLNSVALQIGNLIKYSELANISNLNQQEIKKYLNILEETYIVRLIKPYYKNKRTEVAKASKLFFIDTGVRNSLVKNYNPLSRRTDKGALIENFVFSEFVKNGDFDIKYWRTKSKGEVDFILEKEKIFPVEVKSGISKHPGKALLSFIEKYSPPFAILLHSGNFQIIKRKGINIYFLPFYVNLNKFIEGKLG